MSAADIFAKIQENIVKNPEKATSINAVFQFQLTGDGGGAWNIDLRNAAAGKFVNEGVHESPSVTISMSAADWNGVTSGSLNPMQAFMMGKIKVDGDMGLAMKLQNVLSLAK